MHLVEVKDNETAKDFLKVSVIINKHDPNYIQPLDKDINDVFDPKKNKTLKFGSCKRWLLKDEDGKLIGRIAAFQNKRYKTKGDIGTVGGIGFFDCINSQPAADMLFDVARHWLTTLGVYAIDGPINLGERDRWWGLLVEGFQPPLYGMNYNQPYYQKLFETYGFKVFFNQECYAMKVKDRVQEKFYIRHAQVSTDPDFTARHIEKSKLREYARDFATVYNKAWAGHGAMKEMSPEMVYKLFQKMKPIMDEKIVWFTYYKNQPIGIWVNLPDLNQWFRELHGKFGLLQKLKFLWLKKTVRCKRFTGIAFGIVPEFQGKGIDAFMIMEGANVIQKTLHYEDYEMQWIGDFNPRMINIAAGLGTYISRRLITYRYLLDPTQEFRRHPIFK